MGLKMTSIEFDKLKRKNLRAAVEIELELEFEP